MRNLKPHSQKNTLITPKARRLNSNRATKNNEAMPSGGPTPLSGLHTPRSDSV